ncbi:hypothetical protein CHS0354_028673 [Potamilus streckersoni]|uniref:SH3 domain-containing protein n=1 Tax=Potamilus streckersoni TaxID=2493646 RepID=A0AAE0W258_9BIVA|nr:hypothetical protein CHS0354_028673 [Potamilus streckersoni]
MSDLKLFSGLGSSYSVLSDFPYWFYMMQLRTQLEREFAEKAEKWCKKVSDKLDILEQQKLDGIIQIHSALRMEVTKMEERARFARVSSISYEEAAKLLFAESETHDEKVILRKYETSFQEMLNPYKDFFNRVEKAQKDYEKSMVRLEKLVMDDNESWFRKKKLKTARKAAKRNSNKYIRLVKEKTDQGINITSLSKEYEEVATEIADKRVKSLVGCWSNCLSRLAENSTGEARDMFIKGEKLLNKVDSEMLIKKLSELNKESLITPVYQEFQGTLDVQELLGYRPVLETDIQIDDVKSDASSINVPSKSSLSMDSQSLDSCDIIRNLLHGKKDKEDNKENKPMTPADSYDRVYNPFCFNADEHGEGKKAVEETIPITSCHISDGIYHPLCSSGDEHEEQTKEEKKPLKPVDSCGERRLKRCVTAVAIAGYEKKQCLEMDIKPGERVEQLTRPNSLGMVYGRKKSVITLWKHGGFIPSNCILPS